MEGNRREGMGREEKKRKEFTLFSVKLLVF
jgi:hypothetical protein